MFNDGPSGISDSGGNPDEGPRQNDCNDRSDKKRHEWKPLVGLEPSEQQPSRGALDLVVIVRVRRDQVSDGQRKQLGAAHLSDLNGQEWDSPLLAHLPLLVRERQRLLTGRFLLRAQKKQTANSR